MRGNKDAGSERREGAVKKSTDLVKAKIGTGDAQQPTGDDDTSMFKIVEPLEGFGR